MRVRESAGRDLTQFVGERGRQGAEPVTGTAGTTRMELLEALFHRAQETPAADRTRLVAAWCGGDRALEQELEELLSADQEVVQALSSTPGAGGDTPQRRDDEPWLGRVVGGYRLVSLLGRGGMGVVYRGEPEHAGTSRLPAGANHTAVAVKFMRRSLEGSPALSSFLRERDTLAALQHPNIARLLDAGVTDEAVPFVVMEYIEGQRLDEACAFDPEVADPGAPNTTPPVKHRVRLVLQLCEAVSYVHRNLLLHRDLKPGNVMVTRDGVVKLLDFGTSKMMGAQAQDSDMTQAGMRPVTLRFAAPEHIRGTPLTTASDVFSLGVILYRLLAGQLPPELADLPVFNYLERLAGGAFAPPLAVAPAPGHTGTQCDPALAADLNAITLKCMRAEPEARYGSAAALADDLRRALEARPVEARGDNRRYRLERFYRRNKGSLLMAAAAVLALALGAGVMAHESQVAHSEQRRAESGVAEERKLAHALLFDYFEQLKALPSSTDAQRKAVTEVLAYLDGLSNNKAVRGAVKGSGLELDQVQAYTRMGAVLGSPYEENLGDVKGALAALAKSRALAARLSAQQPDDLLTLEAEMDADKVTGQVNFGAGHLKDAVDALVPGAAVADRIAANPRAKAADFAVAAAGYDLLGDLRGFPDTLNTGEPDRAGDSYRRSLALDEQGLKADPGCTRCRRGIAVEDWKQGLLVEDDFPAQAAVFYRAGLADLATFSPADQMTSRNHRMDTLIRQRLGMMMTRTDDVPGGLLMMNEVRARFLAALAADPIDQRARFDLTALDLNLVESLVNSGDRAGARPVLAEYLREMHTLLKSEPDNTDVEYLYAKGLVKADLETPDGAADRAEGLALLRKLSSDPGASANALNLAAQTVLASGGDPAEALADIRRALTRTSRPDSDMQATLAKAEAAVARAPRRR